MLTPFVIISINFTNVSLEKLNAIQNLGIAHYWNFPPNICEPGLTVYNWNYKK